MRKAVLLLLLLVLCGCREAPSGGADRAVQASGGTEAPPAKLEDFMAVSGTSHLRAGLRSDASRRSSPYDSDPGDLLNFLFYDLDTGATRWLLASPRLIVGDYPLSWPADEQPGSPSPGAGGEVRAFLYLVRERDTDGDGDIDADDAVTLAMSAADGSGYAVLVPEAKEYLGAFWIDEARALVLYEANGAARGAEVDVRTRRVLREVVLPAPPGGAPARP